MKRDTITKCLIVLLLVMGMSGYGYARDVDSESQNVQNDYSHHKTYSASPALTQRDVDQNYQNYATAEGTYYFNDNKGDENGNTLNYVGTVMDWDTDEVIPNAVISFTSDQIKRTITVDQNGRFQIPDLPMGKYGLTIHAKGYQDAFYLNMKMDNIGSTMIGFLYIGKAVSIVEDHDEIEKEKELAGKQPLDCFLEAPTEGAAETERKGVS